MFNEDERRLSVARLAVLKDEQMHLKWLIEYNSLMIDHGLKMNHLETLRGYKKTLKMDKDELQMKSNIIDGLTDQLENGVEILNEADKNERG